jgi:GAF domain-containing protein
MSGITPSRSLIAPSGVAVANMPGGIVIAAGAPSSAFTAIPSRKLGDSFDVLSVLKSVSGFSSERNQRQLLKRLMSIVLETAGATRGLLVLRDEEAGWRIELASSVEDVAAEQQAAAAQAAASSGSDRDVHDDGSSASGSSSDEEDGPATPTSDGYEGDDAMSPPPVAVTSSSARKNLSAVQGTPMSLEGALPLSIFRYVVSAVETVVLSNPGQASDLSAFASDPFFQLHRRPKALLCMPVLQAGVVFGVLELENDYAADAFTSSHIQLLQLLCGQAVLSISNRRKDEALSQHNAHLEEVVRQRTLELQLAKDSAERATRVKSEFLANSPFDK